MGREGKLVVDEHFCRLMREVCSELVLPRLECGFVVLFQPGVVLGAGFLECLLCARVEHTNVLVPRHRRDRDMNSWRGMIQTSLVTLSIGRGEKEDIDKS